MINGLHHTAIATHDIDRLVAFYRDVIGFTPVTTGGWQPGVAQIDAMVGLKGSSAKTAMLQAGNSFLEFFEYQTPRGAPADADRPVNDCGFTHIGLNVTDIEAEYARLTELGMRFHHSPIDFGAGLRAAYGRDPDGNVVELVEVKQAAHPFRLAAAPKPQTYAEAL